jgi:hypothetical protein
MKNVRRGILASQGGYTLIAVIVEATVLLVSFLGLYIGIVYAEAQLIQNYRTRVATLLAPAKWIGRSTTSTSSIVPIPSYRRT